MVFGSVRALDFAISLTRTFAVSAPPLFWSAARSLPSHSVQCLPALGEPSAFDNAVFPGGADSPLDKLQVM